MLYRVGVSLNFTRDRNKSLSICIYTITNYNQLQARTDASFVRETGDGRLMRVPAYFAIPPVVVNNAQDYNIDTLQANLELKVEQWNKRGSNFNIERVSRFVLSVHPYRPLHGSTFVLTPEFLAKKRCLVNIQNNDKKCFVWSVLSALYPPTHHPHRLTNDIDYERSLNVDRLNFPVASKQFPLFEKLNPSISVNVLTFEKSRKGFTVEYRCPERAREHHVNLLLLEDADNPSKRHYVWIKNMSALVSHRTKRTEKQRVCNSCLHPFTSQRVLDEHIPYCFQHEPPQVVYPNPQNEKECVLKFRSKHKQHPYLSTWCAILNRF